MPPLPSLGRWALGRVLRAVGLVGAVLLVTWCLVEALPGDACSARLDPDLDPKAFAAMRAALGCDAPALTRLSADLARVISLDLGVSTSRHVPVRSLLAQALPASLVLGGAGLAIGQGLGWASALVQAPRRGTALDVGVGAVTVLFASVPGFALALALLHGALAFDPTWPATGTSTPWLVPTFAERLQAMLLPAVALGLGAAALDARVARSALVGALTQDHIWAARARGVGESRLLWRHAVPNALLPAVALLGLQLPALVSGAVVVETIFAWPGMGRLLVDAVHAADAPVVLGVFYAYAVVVVAGGVFADLAAVLLDPRIRLAT